MTRNRSKSGPIVGRRSRDIPRRERDYTVPLAPASGAARLLGSAIKATRARIRAKQQEHAVAWGLPSIRLSRSSPRCSPGYPPTKCTNLHPCGTTTSCCCPGGSARRARHSLSRSFSLRRLALLSGLLHSVPSTHCARVFPDLQWMAFSPVRVTAASDTGTGPSGPHSRSRPLTRTPWPDQHP